MLVGNDLGSSNTGRLLVIGCVVAVALGGAVLAEAVDKLPAAVALVV